MKSKRRFLLVGSIDDVAPLTKGTKRTGAIFAKRASFLRGARAACRVGLGIDVDQDFVERHNRGSVNFESIGKRPQ
jgi:hypothetical protein